MIAQLLKSSAKRDAESAAKRRELRQRIANAELSGQAADVEALLEQAALHGVSTGELLELQVHVERLQNLQTELGSDAEFRAAQAKLSSEHDQAKSARQAAEVALKDAAGRESGTLRMLSDALKLRRSLKADSAAARRQIEAWIGEQSSEDESDG